MFQIGTGNKLKFRTFSSQQRQYKQAGKMFYSESLMTCSGSAALHGA